MSEVRCFSLLGESEVRAIELFSWIFLSCIQLSMAPSTCSPARQVIRQAFRSLTHSAHSSGEEQVAPMERSLNGLMDGAFSPGGHCLSKTITLETKAFTSRMCAMPHSRANARKSSSMYPA